MLYQLSYCPQRDGQRTSRLPISCRVRSAGLFMKLVLTAKTAVFLHLESFAIVDLRLHRDVVAPLAIDALKGDFYPLV